MSRHTRSVVLRYRVDPLIIKVAPKLGWTIHRTWCPGSTPTTTRLVTLTNSPRGPSRGNTRKRKFLGGNPTRSKRFRKGPVWNVSFYFLLLSCRGVSLKLWDLKDNVSVPPLVSSSRRPDSLSEQSVFHSNLPPVGPLSVLGGPRRSSCLPQNRGKSRVPFDEKKKRVVRSTGST